MSIAHSLTPNPRFYVCADGRMRWDVFADGTGFSLLSHTSALRYPRPQCTLPFKIRCLYSPRAQMGKMFLQHIHGSAV